MQRHMKQLHSPIGSKLASKRTTKQVQKFDYAPMSRAYSGDVI
jgi:hypothetical protein